MKKLRFTVFAAAALALPLGAQVTKAIRADIPFEFSVGKTTEPAGTYIFSFQAAEGWVRMQPAGGDGRLLTTKPDSPYSIPQEPKLLFHRYGNQYFLSQVGTASTSRDIPMSAREREAQKNTVAAGRQMRTEVVLATR